jgi:hypothetical protein
MAASPGPDHRHRADITQRRMRGGRGLHKGQANCGPFRSEQTGGVDARTRARRPALQRPDTRSPTFTSRLAKPRRQAKNTGAVPTKGYVVTQAGSFLTPQTHPPGTPGPPLPPPDPAPAAPPSGPPPPRASRAVYVRRRDGERKRRGRAQGGYEKTNNQTDQIKNTNNTNTPAWHPDLLQKRCKKPVTKGEKGGDRLNPPSGRGGADRWHPEWAVICTEFRRTACGTGEGQRTASSSLDASARVQHSTPRPAEEAVSGKKAPGGGGGPARGSVRPSQRLLGC